MLKERGFLNSLAPDHLAHAYLVLSTDRPAADQIVSSLKTRLKIAVFDFHLIEAEEGIVSIGAVKDLLRMLSLKPHSSPRHLVYLPEAASLTAEAQNALLKTLEDPPAALFILVAPDESLLLPTVVSRCQRISLGQPGEPAEEDLSAVTKEPLKDQFQLAEKLAKEEDLDKLLDSWIIGLRRRLLAGDRGVLFALHATMSAKSLITATQASKRLVLEDLFLRLKFDQSK